MHSNDILIKNEQEANKLAATITSITITFIALVYILNVVGIFIAPQKAMSIAMGISTFMMLVPPILVFIFKLERLWVKYFIVTVCTLMVAVMSLQLSWHVVVLFIYPIAISSLYFSRRLSWFAVILSILLFTTSQIASLYAGGVGDKNLTAPYEMIVYGILPRSIELLALSLIFITLSKRTKLLLQNVVGAEEQKESLEKIIALTDKSYEVSNVLAESVKKLSSVTVNTIKSNEQIAQKTSSIVDGSQKTIQFVDEAGTIVNTVTSKLDEMAKENYQIAQVSQEVKKLTETNTINMKNAANEMKQIDEATKESRAIITRLGEKSNEISNIAQIIKGISTRTNLLALNASIESARAGEQGKGFSVVASEIRALAEQSRVAADNISVLIQTVLEDTNLAVNSIDLNARIVENGLEIIHMADQSSENVTTSIEKMNLIALDLAAVSSTIAQDGDTISNAVSGISELTYKNMDELMTILVASQNQLDSMNEVAVSVDSISVTSEELLQVVNKGKQ
ncbi:MAG: methyl-accepting chemotaxis sensory transducer [Herbinix sp.]|jgi:methyl-accepting chemotaxis protein|nr:methyl-accepting chemotaxis sensory transducer [Herbinix sp.]